MITRDSFNLIFNEIMTKRGYFITAYLPDALLPMIGEEVYEVAGWPLVKPAVIRAKAKKSDWDKQVDFICSIRPTWRKLDEDPQTPKCKFFKVVMP